jgi:hypothetical protein
MGKPTRSIETSTKEELEIDRTVDPERSRIFDFKI